MGAQPCAEDIDFILDIEGLPNLKCEQVFCHFKRPNGESRKGSCGGITEVQHDNDHVDDGAGLM